MNVLVEMEIPKSCEECPFVYETEGVSHDFCQYVGYESDIEKFVGTRSNERPRWCPFYDKVIEFFSEHETAIYGLGPNDDGAEEGSLLWRIKELDSMLDTNVSIDKRAESIKQRTLKVICALIDIYKNSSNDASYTYYEIWNTVSERARECTERCVSIETAKEHLAKHHSDWCRPVGTGCIYGVTLVPTPTESKEDGSILPGEILMVRTMIYENK